MTTRQDRPILSWLRRWWRIGTHALSRLSSKELLRVLSDAAHQQAAPQIQLKRVEALSAAITDLSDEAQAAECRARLDCRRQEISDLYEAGLIDGSGVRTSLNAIRSTEKKIARSQERNSST
jgi:hypothetical protein